eukprot:TRINITY_DN14463_c0_g2_i1.p1 TRINITY_DN14463_c0_g2~~TRINITY_DN14463_c0_g2_i1.p1  ORF type:complete len:241 (-),score=53.13 TRINITY_DN14463_c0_g2_i1:5-727(-)
MAVDFILSGREAEVIREVAETFCHLSRLPIIRLNTCFDTPSAPPISVYDYVERLWKYMDCSIECFVIGVAYIQRILVKHPHIRMGELNVHTLAFCSILIAAKFHDDVIRSNAFYARVGGVSTAGLRALETNFLQLLDWQASIAPEEFGLCHDLLFCSDRGERLEAVCQGQSLAEYGTGCSTLERGDQQEDGYDSESTYSGASSDIKTEDDGSYDKSLVKTLYKLPAAKIGSTSTMCSLDS